jgi:hypothetical protein
VSFFFFLFCGYISWSWVGAWWNGANLVFRCDIEQEVNGLYTYDRKDKVPAEKVKAIMDAAKDHYYGHVTSHHSRGLRKLLDQYKHVVHRK